MLAADDDKQTTGASKREVKGHVIQVRKDIRHAPRRADEIPLALKSFKDSGMVPFDPSSRALRKDKSPFVDNQQIPVSREGDSDSTAFFRGVCNRCRRRRTELSKNSLRDEDPVKERRKKLLKLDQNEVVQRRGIRDDCHGREVRSMSFRSCSRSSSV